MSKSLKRFAKYSRNSRSAIYEKNEHVDVVYPESDLPEYFTAVDDDTLNQLGLKPTDTDFFRIGANR